MEDRPKAELYIRISTFLQEKNEMIPVLIEQIREVINQTETAVLHLCSRFTNIAERVRLRSEKTDDSRTEEMDSLAKDISEILVSLQFQDITRQRLEHIIKPLTDLKLEIESIIEEINIMRGSVAPPGNGEDLKWLERIYTMETEREVLRKIIREKGGNGHE